MDVEPNSSICSEIDVIITKKRTSKIYRVFDPGITTSLFLSRNYIFYSGKVNNCLHSIFKEHKHAGKNQCEYFL